MPRQRSLTICVADQRILVLKNIDQAIQNCGWVPLDPHENVMIKWSAEEPYRSQYTEEERLSDFQNKRDSLVQYWRSGDDILVGCYWCEGVVKYEIDIKFSGPECLLESFKIIQELIKINSELFYHYSTWDVNISCE